jgi:hypothetical protein
MAEHEEHEQRLAAALRDGPPDRHQRPSRQQGPPARNNLAFLKAQAMVDEFGVTHEQLCATLDDCGDDFSDAASRIFALRDAGRSAQATER